MNLKTNGEQTALTLGDFIAASYRAFGARRAKGLVRLALKAHLVVFRGQQRFVIQEDQHEDLSFKPKAQ